MKFMKLGSKPDLFKSEGDNLRYVATDLATDLVITVGDVKFYLHKFPLLSKSARLQKLISRTSDDHSSGEVHIPDIPGGAAAFEICAKFCYGMTVTLNAYNVVAARCAAEYLEMSETLEKGNLIYKIQVFLNTSIFRSWKDSIIVLQTTKSLLAWCEELKIISQCLEAISSKACMDTSMVDWSYSYNRKKLPSENGGDSQRNGIRIPQSVPSDWWVEDLCELHLDSYKRVIMAIKTRGCSGDVIGEALKAYALRRIPGFSRGSIQGSDLLKHRTLLETIICLLPTAKGSVSCSFLLMLLKAAVSLECKEMIIAELTQRIGCQLHEATVPDLLIETLNGEPTKYDIDLVIKLVENFLTQELGPQNDPHIESEFLEIRSPVFVSDASKAMVAKLIDGYLAECARDQNLPLTKFVDLAERVSSFPRPSHDGIYRAVDMFLKEHPGISKSEKKRICRLIDCKKLSVDACTHAVQNERLPVRVVVQVLFFEQVRASAISTSSTGASTPDPHRSIQNLIPESHGSSRSATTNTDEEWDAVPTALEIKSLKSEINSLKLANGKNNTVKATDHKMKTSLMSKRMFSKMWSSKDGSGENSSSDTSESHGSTNAGQTQTKYRDAHMLA